MCENYVEKLLLVGNPNTGKSTLFNSITKSNAHTGNFHGVTVSSQEKNFKIKEKEYNLVDLPGIYSLSPNSYEEEFSVDYLLSNPKCNVICVCTNQTLKRNMLLLMDLLQLKRKVILAINNIDKKNNININKLKEILNIEIVLINAKNSKTVKPLLDLIYNNNFYSSNLNFENNKINNLKNTIKNATYDDKTLSFFCDKVLCRDEYYIKKLNLNNKIIDNIDKNYLDNKIKNRYLLINKILHESQYSCNFVVGKSKLDKIVLNKYLCIPIFLMIMSLIFYITFFSLGLYLSNFLRWLLQDVLGTFVMSVLTKYVNIIWICNLVKEGLFGGVGTIVSFLPQIVLLFVFLALLEDSGYLSRLAFLVDDALKKVGLSGKSVYTLLMSFGCSTSACLTSRTMTDKNAKIKTALLTPYMSCSAKLPVYAVIGGAFFGVNNILIIVLLYVIGIIIALILSIFLEKTFFVSKKQTFIMEFPSYRKIDLKHIFAVTKLNIKSFLLKIGSILLGMSIIVWFFENFSFSLKYIKGTSNKSILQNIGEFVAPIFKPLGFGSWGCASALLAGIVAKEIIVSSIAMFNNVNTGTNNFMSSISQTLINPLSVVFFTPASALSFMVFCLLYCPCLGTIMVLKKEIGRKWTYIGIALQFVLAYVTSMFVYFVFNLTLIFGAFTVVVIVLLCLAIISTILNLIKIKKTDVICYGCDNKTCKHKK